MRRSPVRPAGAAFPAALALALLAGCGASGTAQSAAGTPGTQSPMPSADRSRVRPAARRQRAFRYWWRSRTGRPAAPPR